MIEYKTKNIISEFKIGENSYKVNINQTHTDSGPKVKIDVVGVSADSGAFYINVSDLEAFEVHTALNEVIKTLATITHVHYGVPVAAVAAPAPCIDRQ
jgi:hypothetical protein